MTEVAKVSVAVARAMLDTACRSGIARAPLLAAARLSPSWPACAGARVPRSQVYALCEAALALSTDRALGLRWGEIVADQTFTVVSPLVTHAPTLGDAFGALLRFSKLLTDECGVQLLERNGRCVVQCPSLVAAPLPLRRLVTEMRVGGICRLIRSYCPTARLERVSFAYPSPSYHRQYTRAFDAAERFGCSANEIVFDAALMGVASERWESDLDEALRQVAERRLLSVLQQTPYAVRVREILTRDPTSHRLSMEGVATELEMSERSLRRYLMREGEAYPTIRTQAAVAVAARLLVEEGRTIQDTAYRMAFVDASSFHRAFKRWTGSTPREFRARCLQPASACPHPANDA